MTPCSALPKRTFNQFDSFDFEKLKAVGKAAGVTPPVVVVSHLAKALHELGINKKLAKDRKGLEYRDSVDIGIAVDVGFGLRTCGFQRASA